MTLSSVDYSGKDLNGRDLSNQNFSGYKFTHTQMDGANLRNSILDGANLEYAQLSGAILINCSLRGTNLVNAQLNGADLSGTNVRGARFKGSSGLSEKIKRDLEARGAIFDDDSKPIDRKWWLEKVLIPLATLLIGSSGIVGIWQLSQQKPLNSQLHTIENTQPVSKNNSHR